MTVMICFAFALATVSPPVVDVPPRPASDPVEADDALARARVIYRLGEARFAAGDYGEAIAEWTALADSLPDEAAFNAVRLDLLFNIGVAHERRFDAHGDLADLHRALAAFERHAVQRPGGDGEAQIARLRGKLSPPPDGGASASPTRRDVAPARVRADTKRARGIGIGIAAAGIAAVGGGAALLAVGVGLRPRAQRQVAVLDQQGVPPEHPSRSAAARFVEAETRKGRRTVAAGGALLTVGAAAVGIGLWTSLRRPGARSTRTARVRLMPAPGGAVVEGRF